MDDSSNIIRIGILPAVTVFFTTMSSTFSDSKVSKQVHPRIFYDHVHLNPLSLKWQTCFGINCIDDTCGWKLEAYVYNYTTYIWGLHYPSLGLSKFIGWMIDVSHIEVEYHLKLMFILGCSNYSKKIIAYNGQHTHVFLLTQWSSMNIKFTQSMDLLQIKVESNMTRT